MTAGASLALPAGAGTTCCLTSSGKRTITAAARLHGVGGEWRVERPRVSWPILDAVREAGVEIGIPKIDDFNQGDNEGSGYFEVNQRRGRRWSAATAFLKPILKRPNLRLETGAHVERILFEGRRAAGLRYSQHGVSREARARGEVILSAGAIGSPQLLELSGVGAPDRLKAIGAPVVHALPGVGENLQDHLQLRAIFGVDRRPHAECRLSVAAQAGDDGARLWLSPARAVDHGAVAARPVRQVLARLRHRQYRIPCPTAVARPFRRAACTPIRR